MVNLKKLILLLNIYLIGLSLELNGIKLTGKIISSDYSLEQEYAFDGDLNTEFKSSSMSNGWVGLKLDSRYRITKIGWAQRNIDKSNYLLGIFEGANEPTFIDAAPLYMITEEGKIGEINYVNIDVTKKYKFIRYVGPNKKFSVISEFEIYGDESNTEKNEDEDKYWYQPTNIPLIVIHTEESVEPYDKQNYISCNIIIIKNNKKDKEENGSIMLRGNATLRLEKKAYKIKFNSKIKPLDLPAKAKKWNLLANHSDKTLIRNTLALKISTLFGMSFTPMCTPVDLMLNGEFKGNYGFCDVVEEGKNRIEVTEMDETCIKEPEITGGYVFSADAYAKQEGGYIETNKGIIYTIKYPDEEDIISEQSNYLQNFFNIAEAECYDNKIDKIDSETFCKYLLIEELCGNSETFWSTYMTKERSNEKIYFGPVWDFDISFDNDMRVYPTLEKNDFLFKFGTSAGTMKQFAIQILRNENLLQKLKDTWKEYTSSKVTKEVLLNYIEEQIKIIDESQKLNFMRWDILNKKILVNPVARGSYKAETEYLKEYIQKRFDLVNNIIKNSTVSSVSILIEKKREVN